MFAKAPLDSLKSTIIITAVPVSITLIFCIISIFKWLKQDYGDMTRDEITRLEKETPPDLPETGDLSPSTGEKQV